MTPAPRPRRGGRITWACTPGFPAAAIFPILPSGRFGARSLYEFQMLMYRPLYWYGTKGTPDVDYELSLALPPAWSEDGLSATVTIKPYKWSNGETVDADGVMFWMHMLEVEKENYGGYVPGFFPDNLASYEKVAPNAVRFTFDRPYSKNWVLMNQFSLITPLPRAWDRTDAGPADATHSKADCHAVYQYLMSQNGDVYAEDNHHRTRWADSPLWSIVNGPWRLKSFALDGTATMVPNEAYSGPNKPYADEFVLLPTESDISEYEILRSDPRGERKIDIGFLPFDAITEPTDDPAKGGPNPLDDRYRLVPQILYSIHYFPYNFNNPTIAADIFRQLYFRQALQSTLDQESTYRDIYYGYGYPTYGPVPALPRNELVSPKLTANPYPFSIRKARELLTAHGWDLSTTPAVCTEGGPAGAGAGIEPGTRLSLSLRYASGHPTLKRLLGKLKEDAGQAGIELTLSEIYPSVLVAQDTKCVPTAETPCRWEMSCWNGGWVYGPNFYPTGELLYKTDAGCNFGSYSDKRADELIARTVESDDLDDLYAYQEYIAEQVPVVWTPNFPLRLFEVANNLHGVEPVNPLGFINPENWYYSDDS
jgi:peptide/nickel transport system substrate-binding protein